MSRLLSVVVDSGSASLQAWSHTSKACSQTFDGRFGFAFCHSMTPFSLHSLSLLRIAWAAMFEICWHTMDRTCMANRSR